MKLKERIKRFFFPPANVPRWVKIMPFALMGVLTLLFLTASAYAWEYTNSPEFCGTSCHTMPPEYTAYLVSPHARIDCVDCHIGKGFIATRITRKAGDLKHVFATLFVTYEFPIRVHELRPARETCELCHFPEKFSDDSLREIQRFTEDKNNTPYSIYLTLKTGGGSERQGLGRGIHWHIQNEILFYSTDPEQQEIPYVKVINEDGSSEEFIDVGANFDRASLEGVELEEMDCATCHNRITHLVTTPQDTVDEMIARGQISREIPEIRRQAVAVYSQIYDRQETGLVGIAALEEFYRIYYPDFMQDKGELVKAAIEALQEAYSNSVYPEQNSDWSTHPNNVGHKETPGCLRCHDGKHINAQEESIRLECNLCHSIPVVAGPDDFVANLEISRGPEPETHKNSNWIAMHNQVFNETCANCHDTADAGGTSNTSFCSNSACHGSKWEFAGFDAPRLREILQGQLPPVPTPEALPEGAAVTYDNTIAALLTKCTGCHESGGVMDLDLSSYAGMMAGGSSGPAVIAGDAANSLLVQKQIGADPHFAQFTTEELQTVVDWINSGALEK